MAKLKSLIFASTIGSTLALATGLAHADSNFANVEQNGSGNDGMVTQGPGDFNKVGTGSNSSPGAALQKGNDNDLTITQSGSMNEVGTTGRGFDQIGNRNKAVVTQSSDGNTIGEVQQVDETRFGSADRNTFDAVQGGTGRNTIGSVLQTRTNTPLFNSGAGNKAAVTQNSDSNTLSVLRQEGRGNDVRLVQTGGTGNRVGTISQTGVLGAAGVSNRITLTFNGANNGTAGFSAVRLSGTAAFGQLTQGNVTQSGIGNTINDFVVTGDRNAFGFSQTGLAAHSIDGWVNGSDNQFGVYQFGTAGTATVEISGDRNEIYLGQDGAFNNAFAKARGDENGIVITQVDNSNTGGVDVTGNLNLVTLNQSGGQVLGNDAAVNIVGDSNFADIAQTKRGIGRVNTLTLNIFGNNNNNPTLPTFGGDAATAALGTGLKPGSIIQSGAGNSITMNVGSSTQPSAADDNVFAFLQNGGHNTIVGAVLGHSNQAVVVQNGAGNFTSFTQTGNFNIIGINQ